MLLVLPFLAVGLVLNARYPAVFSVGGPPGWLEVLAVTLLVPGVTIWAWSAALILRYVPRDRIITSGPFELVKHPLYTAVALLVVPSVGLLFDSWLGLPLGAVLYLGSRLYSPLEERALADQFGAEWERYRDAVMLPWL